MATKSVPLTIAPLQRVVATPVTDPAKLARFEKARRKARRKRAGASRSVSKTPRRG
jgi:hypothetical protein